MSNYFSRYTDAYWDHERDLRKHDRGIPDRLDVPVPTAVEVAALVKGMSNITEAAKLIEQYADAKAAATRLDAVAAGAHA